MPYRIGNYAECRGKKRGTPKQLCNAMVFAEKHPKTAKMMVNVGCPALKLAIKHPKVMRITRKLL